MSALRMRGRITLAAAAATAAALACVVLLAAPELRSWAIAQDREALAGQARLVARLAAAVLDEGPRLSAVVRDAAAQVGARVTVIGPDGRVLADSALRDAELAEVDNHGQRPEVVEARRVGLGSATRLSATVGTELLYVAVPLADGRGVARLARSMTRIDAQIASLSRAVLLALGVAFAVTVVLSVVVAGGLTRPLDALAAVARRHAQGDLGARAPVEGAAEVRELARIVNDTAATLERRLAEDERARAQAAAILSSIDDGVLAVDAGGTVVLASPGLATWLEAGAPLGRPYRDAIRRDELSEVVAAVLATGERQRRDLELPHERRAVTITGAPFRGSATEAPGAVVTVHDVSELRRLDRVRRDFVANASHELRTPLTSIRGFVEALEDGAVDDPAVAKRFLSKIRTHADRMATLVSELLELSRLEAGERAPDWEELAPGELAAEVVASFAGIAGRRGTSLAAQGGDGAPAIVTDVERLRRILENLVDNALKYTPEGGRVEVLVARTAAGGVTVAVRDDGPGIAATHLPRIFERFYRVDKARSRDVGGTGLGLAIVRHLADSIGARVEVASTLDVGTQFTVHLPRDPRSPRQAT